MWMLLQNRQGGGGGEVYLGLILSYVDENSLPDGPGRPPGDFLRYLRHVLAIRCFSFLLDGQAKLWWFLFSFSFFILLFPVHYRVILAPTRRREGFGRKEKSWT